MRRLAGVLVVVCAALAATPAGAFDGGTYKGKHSQGKALTFKLVSKVTHKKGKKVVKRIVRLRGPFTKVDVTCPDDFVYHVGVNSFDENGKPNNTDIPVHGSSFSFAKPEAPLRFSGHFAGKHKKSHASGKFSYHLEAAQHGGDCKSGTLTWSAHRR